MPDLLLMPLTLLVVLLIGVVQRGISVTEALQSYTILTIGDGLVSQVPAFLIATAAGMVVTKSASGKSMDSQMKTQLFSNPRVFGTVSGAILIVFNSSRNADYYHFYYLVEAWQLTTFLVNKSKKEQP